MAGIPPDNSAARLRAEMRTPRAPDSPHSSSSLRLPPVHTLCGHRAKRPCSRSRAHNRRGRGTSRSCHTASRYWLSSPRKPVQRRRGIARSYMLRKADRWGRTCPRIRSCHRRRYRHSSARLRRNRTQPSNRFGCERRSSTRSRSRTRGSWDSARRGRKERGGRRNCLLRR